MMKKIIVLLLVSFVIWSCRNDVLSDFPEDHPSNETLSGSDVKLMELPCGLVVEEVDGKYFLEDDILLSQEQFDALSNTTRGAIYELNYRKWPNNTVYYRFDPGFTNQEMALDAIRHWEEKTKLRFFPVTQYPSNDYINFIFGDRNASSLGKIGGRQDIILKQGAFGTGTIIHEIGHAIGMFHEHTRSDRDNHVIVNFSNIKSDKQHNFIKYTQSSSHGLDRGTFDFNSIMLYPSVTGFEIDPSIPSMVRKSDGNIFYAQRNGLSPGDISAVDYKYTGITPLNYRALNNEYVTLRWTGSTLNSDANPWRAVCTNKQGFVTIVSQTKTSVTIECTVHSKVIVPPGTPPGITPPPNEARFEISYGDYAEKAVVVCAKDPL